MPRRMLLRIAQAIVLAAVTWFIARALASQWAAVRAAYAAADPRWGLVVLSVALTLLTYALLIETWRVVLAGWGVRIPFRAAAHIWWVSGLGKYVPGKVWAMGTVAVLAQRAGIPTMRAAGSSVVIMIVNTLAGFLVIAALGPRALRLPPAALAALAGISLGLLIAPPLFPRAAALASRLLRRTVVLPALPRRYVLLATATSVLAWVMYGIAFQLLAAGITGGSLGAPSVYIAAFAGSYLSGFLALVAPGGLGVREFVMVQVLSGAGAGAGAAWLIAAASRLTLTLLEVVPAIGFLVAEQRRSRARGRQARCAAETRAS